ncbi:MAG: aspartate kinase [Blastocatellia bacterium]|nr:aspartate kinase [Blastocatellia bacterium]
MDINVLKFGGSCVKSVAALAAVAGLVDRSVRQRGTIVVVSALRGVTDDLVAAADAPTPAEAESIVGRLRGRHLDVLEGLGAGPTDKARYVRHLDATLDGLRVKLEMHAIGGSSDTRDSILATGERLATPLVALSCTLAGRAAHPVDAASVLVTDDRFGAARPNERASEDAVLRRIYMEGVFAGAVPVVTGFIGRTRDGRTTTLGRNGSDLSAAVIASIVKARQLVFFKDVDGILQADPHLVDDPGVVPRLSFDEASDLASVGVQPIHPLALGSLRDGTTAVEFRNAFNPEHPGTAIRREDVDAPASIKTVVATGDVRLVSFELGRETTRGSRSTFAQALSKATRIDPSVVTIGGGGAEPAATFLTRASCADAIVDALVRDADSGVQRFQAPRDVVAAAIVGDGVWRDSGVAARALSALGGRGRFVHSMSRSPNACALRFVVEGLSAKEAAEALYPLTAA